LQFQINVLSLYQQNKIIMTNIQILNEKLNSILGLRYSATNENGLVIRFDNYKMGNTLVLSEIEKKAGVEVKKEISKICLLIQFGK